MKISIHFELIEFISNCEWVGVYFLTCSDHLQCLQSLSKSCQYIPNNFVSPVHFPAGYATPKASWIPNRERERLIPVLPQVPAALHPIFPSFPVLLIPLSQLH